MYSKRAICYISAVAALILSAPAAIAANRSYELGLEASSSYRYSEALMHFTLAAEQGDASAQRSLGLMLLYGDRLYGREVPRNHAQARRWLEAAAGQGCEVSSFMLKAMARRLTGATFISTWTGGISCISNFLSQPLYWGCCWR